MNSSKMAIALSLLALSLITNSSWAQNALTIDFYALNKEVYDGAIPINSVLRAPKNTKWATSECFSNPTQTSQTKDDSCSPNVRELLSQCKVEVQKILNETAPRYSDSVEPHFAVIPLANNRKVLLFRSFFGGSGGARVDWSLFFLKSLEMGKFSCPESPLLSGVEVTPGGNVWYETYCDKQKYAACAERLFYPKENAIRLEFTKSGTLMSKIPNGYIPPDLD